MTYAQMLREATKRTGSIVCVGFDPVIERIPLRGNPESVITEFCCEILEAFAQADCLPGAIKPNSAYFEQYGPEGISALINVIEKAHTLKIPVILDAKRGDIGRTSAAYAKAAYDAFNADAVTLNPYLGFDSITPFLDGKHGVYVLVHTTNATAGQVQELSADGKPVFLHVAELLRAHWQTGLGAVVPGNDPVILGKLAALFAQKEMPLLIPGVGTQGGSALSVIEVLKEAGYDLTICRINSSSGITYAHEQQTGTTFQEAAVTALKKLHAEIGR